MLCMTAGGEWEREGGRGQTTGLISSAEDTGFSSKEMTKRGRIFSRAGTPLMFQSSLQLL